MSNPEGVIKERRSSSHKLIRRFVSERTELLSLFNELASKHPYHDTESVSELLEQFCQSLIDYTADAHFRLYHYIDERKERRRNVTEAAEKVYPQIVEITQIILDFNDKYDSSEHDIVVNELERDLSQLGEKLADRIELEDSIISALIEGRG